MRIDFSITAVDAPAGTAKRAYQTVDGYYYTPDCDLAPIPLPPGGVVEDYPQDPPPADSFTGYDCSGFADGADCHMIVVSRSEQRIYEIYHATIDRANKVILVRYHGLVHAFSLECPHRAMVQCDVAQADNRCQCRIGSTVTHCGSLTCSSSGHCACGSIRT